MKILKSLFILLVSTLLMVHANDTRRLSGKSSYSMKSGSRRLSGKSSYSMKSGSRRLSGKSSYSMKSGSRRHLRA